MCTSISKHFLMVVLWLKHVISSALFKYMVLLFCSTFLLVLPICLFSTRNSLYYFTTNNTTASQDYEREINSVRIAKAEQYLQTLNNTNLQSILQFSKPVYLAISIITLSRRNIIQNQKYDPKYLTQTVAKVLSLMTEAGSDFAHTIKLAICNVDTDPNSFLEVEEVGRFLPVVNRFTSKHASKSHILEKEKQDYAFCLNHSLTFKPRYVLMIEDDALPKDNLFSVLRYTLEMHLEQRYHDEEFYPPQKNLAFVKFYHPERLLGYLSLDIERFTELSGYVAIFSTVVVGMLNYVFNIEKNITLTWLILCVYFFLVFLSIGRANVDEWRNVFSPYLHSFAPAPSCCTPAMLFPNSGAQQVVSYLNSVTCKVHFGKDTVLDQMHRIENTKAYIVQPNTFQHIGMYSTLHKKLADPSII